MFKKLFILIALTVTLAGAAEKFKFPGFGLKEAKYDAVLTKIKSGEMNATSSNIVLVSICKTYANGAPDDLQAIYAKAAEANAATSAPAKDNGASSVPVFITSSYGKGNVISKTLLVSLYQHLQDTADPYLAAFVRSKKICEALSITDDARIKVITERSAITYNPVLAERVVDVLCDALPKSHLSDAEQLAILKKYNKIYSVHLTDANKDKWEPVLTKLRTVILAY